MLTARELVALPRDRQRFERYMGEKTPTGCIPWTGATHRGYGLFGALGRSLRAHRYAYALFVGPVPDGRVVCHRCDNPRCVNPEHLFLGTQRENVLDCMAKGRSMSHVGHPSPRRGVKLPPATHCRRGHEMTPENGYAYARGLVECRECRKIRRKNPAVRPAPKCRVDSCDRIVRARGLCCMHYQRERKTERGYWL